MKTTHTTVAVPLATANSSSLLCLGRDTTFFRIHTQLQDNIRSGIYFMTPHGCYDSVDRTALILAIGCRAANNQLVPVFEQRSGRRQPQAVRPIRLLPAFYLVKGIDWAVIWAEATLEWTERYSLSKGAVGPQIDCDFFQAVDCSHC